MLVWDEVKREANLAKHGLDFADADLVLDNPEKITVESPRGDEQRLMDIAMVELAGVVLVLVYLKQGKDIRVVSFRPASRKERIKYARTKEQN